MTDKVASKSRFNRTVYVVQTRRTESDAWYHTLSDCYRTREVAEHKARMFKVARPMFQVRVVERPL